MTSRRFRNPLTADGLATPLGRLLVAIFVAIWIGGGVEFRKPQAPETAEPLCRILDDMVRVAAGGGGASEIRHLFATLGRLVGEGSRICKGTFEGAPSSDRLAVPAERGGGLFFDTGRSRPVEPAPAFASLCLAPEPPPPEEQAGGSIPFPNPDLKFGQQGSEAVSLPEEAS